MKRARNQELAAFPLIMPMHLFSAYDCTNWGKLGCIYGFRGLFGTFGHTT